ncbi:MULTISPECIES: hypothetical protein [unclassified Microbulbifer]|uniref:hypothetical protein n=1 Tax=unclassified Microbulbifer TaxID=2619833 RepID=UPI0027E4228D|nr:MULTISPECIES: hypothetical protein [unclassified Microbulbifer]
MPREKSESEKAAGKLISAVQKEWHEELGEPQADLSEDVMGLAHELLQARTSKAMTTLLGSRTVKQFLGERWVYDHPSVEAGIKSLEQAIERENA